MRTSFVALLLALVAPFPSQALAGEVLPGAVWTVIAPDFSTSLRATAQGNILVNRCTPTDDLPHTWVQTLAPDGSTLWTATETWGCPATSDADGNTYVLTKDTAGYLTAESLDSSGELRWITNTNVLLGGEGVAPVLGADGSVYFADVANGYYTESNIVGFDRATGNLTFQQTAGWTHRLLAYADGLAAVTFPNTVQYFGYDGMPKGTYRLGTFMQGNDSSAAGADGTVFVAGFANHECHGVATKTSVSKITPSGVAWTWGQPEPHQCSGLYLAATPDGGVVFASASDEDRTAADVIYLDAWGIPRWTYRTAGSATAATPGIYWPPVVDASGVVVLPSHFAYTDSDCGITPACAGLEVAFLSQQTGARVLPTIQVVDPTAAYGFVAVGETPTVDAERLYLLLNANSTSASVSSLLVPGLNLDYQIALEKRVASGTTPTPPVPTPQPPAGSTGTPVTVEIIAPTQPFGQAPRTSPRPGCKLPKAVGKQIRAFSYGKTLATGTSATVSASVTKVGWFAGQPSTTVTFKVACGPNAGRSAISKTNYYGETSFTYKGTKGPGTDIVSATFGTPNGKQQAIVKIKWITPPPPTRPCTPPAKNGIGDRLLASLRCTAAQFVLAGQCAVAVAGFVFIPIRSLKLAKGADGLLALSALDKRFHPAAVLYNKLSIVKYKSNAPKGLRTPKEVLQRIDHVHKASDLARLLPELFAAMSAHDFSEVAADIAEVAGLKPCVQALVKTLD